MNSRSLSAAKALPVIIMTLMTITSACNQKTKIVQPELGARSVDILNQDGFQFKDLNRNGELDRYEDWRLSPEERSNDLLSRMSVEEKAGFMMINSLNMVGTRAAEESGGTLSASDLSEGGGSGFGGFGAPPAARQQGQGNSERQNADNDRRQGAGNTAGPGAARQGAGNAAGEREQNQAGGFIANMNRAAGTTAMVKDYHMRHFILRANESARVTAEWANKLQELCEGEPLGIPAIITSNPRNNITTNASLGTSVGTTAFTSWPGELGLSAMRDLDLVREFADDSRQEWVAVGLRKGYMYMADLATEPRWSRVNGTFGENPDWVAQVIREVVLGFQGKTLNSGSVALTTKHFPGGGSGKKGLDSHFDFGKAEVYPGGRFKDNLVPFQAAIDAGTSAIMPYYSLPEGTEYEEVGYAFNRGVLQDLLRDQMGFTGIINSDTGPLTGMPWGVENLTKEERYVKAIEAGVNIFSGESDPAMLIGLIRNGSVDMSLIDNSVYLLLKEKFRLGLFENPYVDAEAAEDIVSNEKFRQSAALAMRKSIVLLRNETGSLPLKPGTKVYFESLQMSQRGPQSNEPDIYTLNNDQYDLEFVETPREAEIVILWIQPGGNSLFRSTGDPVSLSLSQCGVDIDYVNGISSQKPTLLVINYTNPWVINEIYNQQTENIAGVLATFGTTPDALLDVITGKYNPTGKMPFSTPVSDEAVENQLEDVPGYLEGAGYALFNYDEGISY